uniref:RING-type E3 ubiquitin transferase n=1 Tax=Chaetoceros debilis TaxID=122233 RepID=A0A7S3Q360_9STRA
MAVIATIATSSSPPSPRKLHPYELALKELTFLTDETAKCQICLETISDAHIIPGCLHRFCGGCIKESLQKNGNECTECGGKVHVLTKNYLRKDVKFDTFIKVAIKVKKLIEDEIGTTALSSIEIAEEMRAISPTSTIQPMLQLQPSVAEQKALQRQPRDSNEVGGGEQTSKAPSPLQSEENMESRSNLVKLAIPEILVDLNSDGSRVLKVEESGTTEDKNIKIIKQDVDGDGHCEETQKAGTMEDKNMNIIKQDEDGDGHCEETQKAGTMEDKNMNIIRHDVDGDGYCEETNGITTISIVSCTDNCMIVSPELGLSQNRRTDPFTTRDSNRQSVTTTAALPTNSNTIDHRQPISDEHNLNTERHTNTTVQQTTESTYARKLNSFDENDVHRLHFAKFEGHINRDGEQIWRPCLVYPNFQELINTVRKSEIHQSHKLKLHALLSLERYKYHHHHGWDKPVIRFLGLRYNRRERYRLRFVDKNDEAPNIKDFSKHREEMEIKYADTDRLKWKSALVEADEVIASGCSSVDMRDGVMDAVDDESKVIDDKVLRLVPPAKRKGARHLRQGNIQSIQISETFVKKNNQNSSPLTRSTSSSKKRKQYMQLPETLVKRKKEKCSSKPPPAKREKRLALSSKEEKGFVRDSIAAREESVENSSCKKPHLKRKRGRTPKNNDRLIKGFARDTIAAGGETVENSSCKKPHVNRKRGRQPKNKDRLIKDFLKVPIRVVAGGKSVENSSCKKPHVKRKRGRPPKNKDQLINDFLKVPIVAGGKSVENSSCKTPSVKRKIGRPPKNKDHLINVSEALMKQNLNDSSRKIVHVKGRRGRPPKQRRDESLQMSDILVKQDMQNPRQDLKVISTSMNNELWAKLSISNLLRWAPIKGISWTDGQSTKGLLGKIDSRIENLRHNIIIEVKRLGCDNEGDEYLAENRLYQRGIRDRMNKAGSEALERLMNDKECDERQRWVEYTNRGKKKSAQELDFEEFLSRPFRIIKKNRSIPTRGNKCPFEKISCKLCNGRYAADILTRKENEANAGAGCERLLQHQTLCENRKEKVIPSPRVHRIINDDDLPDDRDEPRSTASADESPKVRVISRRGNDRIDLNNLQELSTSIQFIEAFNKNSEV